MGNTAYSGITESSVLKTKDYKCNVSEGIYDISEGIYDISEGICIIQF